MKIFSQKSFDAENIAKVAPAKYLEVMFANIENGALSIAKEEDELRSDLAESEGSATCIYDYKIDMARADVNAIAEEAEALIADFKKIAERGGIDISAKDAKTILGDRLFKVWEKYVRRSASESEEDIIAEHAARIGGKVCAANVVNRAQRLVRAFELGAPECVVLNEERCFAEAFALNICADEVKTGGYYVGHRR